MVSSFYFISSFSLFLPAKEENVSSQPVAHVIREMGVNESKWFLVPSMTKEKEKEKYCALQILKKKEKKDI